MEDLKQDAAALWHEGKGYVDKQIELIKLEIIEESAEIAGNYTALTLILGFILIFASLFGIFLGVLLGDVLENYTLGFAIVTGAYLIVLIMLIVFRDKFIVSPLKNLILGKILDRYEQKKKQSR